MGYKYEIHMHTCVSSACGRTAPEDYIQAFIDCGYDGIIITDHFYHGNTAVDRNLPWPDFVEQYCRSYERAKEAGDRLGLKVFFGWEESQHPDEYLIYGLDKQWLLDHPEIKDADHTETLRLVHEGGGVVVGAHPFRERAYVDIVKIHPFQCDAMEVCNYGNPPYQDILAYNFCKDRNILMTSGGDIHDVKNVYTNISGMMFDKPLESIADFVEAIKTGRGFTPVIPDERRAPITPDIANTLPMKLYDGHNVGRDVVMADLFPEV